MMMKTFVELVVKRQWLLFICCVTAAIGCKSTQQLPAVHADFFVAADGNDANPGTADKPFATLARARDAVRQKIAAGLDHNMVVMIRGGRYELTEPLVLRSEDSGTEKFAVTYAAAPTERVEISGGRFIRGWKRGSDHLWIADVTGTSHARWTVHQVFVNDQPRQRPKS